METRLEKIGSQPDAALSELATHRNRLRDEVGNLSADRSVFIVKLETTRHKLRATKTEAWVVGGMLTEQHGLKEEAKQ